MALYAPSSYRNKIPDHRPNIYVNWFIRGKFDRLELRLMYAQKLDKVIARRRYHDLTER